MDGNLKVLVVEDDPDQAELVCTTLSRSNPDFSIDLASSGEECLHLVSQNCYVAVLLDFHLPDCTGEELLQAITKSRGDIPIVVASGNGSEKIAVDMLKKGAYDYIVKDSGYLKIIPNALGKAIDKFALESRLRETERKYKKIFESANDLIVIVSPSTSLLLDANPKACEILGYAKEALVPADFLSLFPLDYRDKAKSVLQTTIREGRHNEPELVMITAENTTLPVSLTSGVINLSNEECVLCNIRDTSTEKKLETLILNSKKRLQGTFDGIADPIFQVNRDYEVIIANREYAEKSGGQPEQIVGKKCHDLFLNCGPHDPDCPIALTFDDAQTHVCEKNVGNRIFEITSYPIQTIDGVIESVAVYCRDISEKRQMERTLIQSEKLSTLGLLAAGVAHEIRNPLNVIETARYYIQEFLEGMNDDIASKLKIIRKNVDRASGIINNLLEFSRHSEYEREAFALAELMQSTVTLVRKEFQAKHIECSIECAEDIRVFFSVDSAKQVLLNLLINAIHAMPNGGRLDVTARQNNDGLVEIRVSDTGVGISPEHLPLIFTPFFTTKEAGVGTGLGLYISHMIIEREGGTISVESEVNAGTTFTVLLPSA